MPTPRSDETREEWLDRCIPVVLDDGTAEDRDQAVAICSSMWEEAKMNRERPVRLRVDCSFEIKAVGDDGTIEGYGSTFGNVDFGMDRIERGAFSDWLEGTKTLPMLWQHDSGEPIGLWTRMREDRRGLYVKGQLNLSKDSGQPDVPTAFKARALAKQGAVTGLSIGYWAREWSFEDDVRVLERVDLDEISMVTFPMNPEARVAAVKHATRPELEIMIRERLGLSRRAAEKLLDAGFAGLSRDEDPASPTAVVSEIRRRVDDIRKLLG